MYYIQKTFSAAGYHFYHSITSPKVWAAFLVLFTILFQAHVAGSSISNGLSVFYRLFGFGYPIVRSAMLMIFSELPFDDPQQKMLITRTGKRCWYISQLLYVIMECLLVMLFITVFTFIFTWGKIDLTSEIEEFQWCYPISFFVFVIYGSLIFVLNTLKRYAGTIFGAVLIALQLFQNWVIWKEIKYASMLGWCDYTTVKDIGDSGQIFVIIALIVLYATAVGLAVFNSRKKKDLNM